MLKGLTRTELYMGLVHSKKWSRLLRTARFLGVPRVIRGRNSRRELRKPNRNAHGEEPGNRPQDRSSTFQYASSRKFFQISG